MFPWPGKGSLYVDGAAKSYHKIPGCEDAVMYVITRDPIQKLWSAYWWGTYRWKVPNTKLLTFKDWLNNRETDWRARTSGLSDPIGACDYNKFIQTAWDEGFEPIILRFEDMIKNPNFPHEARTEDVVLKNNRITMVKPPLDDTTREFIISKFVERGIEYDKY